MNNITSNVHTGKSYSWGITKSYHTVEKDNHKGSVVKSQNYIDISLSQFKITKKKKRTFNSTGNFVENQTGKILQ